MNTAIITKSGISLTLFGKLYSVSKSNKKFKQVKKLAVEKKWKEIEKILDVVKEIEKYSKNQIVEKNGNFYLGKDLIPIVLGKRILQMKKRRVKFEYLLKFWENLRKNPSDFSKQQLFGFLEANHFPLTSDGKFLAYKKVTSINNGILVDSHSRKFNNNIGTTVKMDRQLVDSNPTRTCSTGLHVAAWKYAQDFTGDVLVEVIVNPKDVVAVPVDYDNQKMRVCEYQVFGKAKNERKNLVVKV